MAAERKEEQLRGWLQEVRIERRKLEDRLLQGSSCALQDTRAELEAAVTALRSSLAAAEAEGVAMGAAAAERARLQVRQYTLAEAEWVSADLLFALTRWLSDASPAKSDAGGCGGASARASKRPRAL